MTFGGGCPGPSGAGAPRVRGRARCAGRAVQYLACVSKHAAPSTVNWGQRLLLVLLALVVGAAAWGAVRLLQDGPDRAEDAASTTPDRTAASTADGTTDAAPATQPADAGATATATLAPEAAAATTAQPECGTATVWAAPAILPAVQQAAQRAGDDCLGYDVVEQGSSAAQAALSGGETPDVWVPDSTAWPQLMSEAGVDLEVGETVASSPVLLTGAPQVVEALSALGIGADSTWADVSARYRELTQEALASGEAPPVSVRLGDPRTDPATMGLLAASAAQLGDWSERGSDGRRQLAQLAQNAIKGDPLAALRSDPRTLVPATEQQIAGALAQGVELAGVPLAGGAGVVQMPFVRVGDGADAGDAVDVLEEQLTGETAAGDLLALGLRPGTDGPAPEVPGVPEGVTVEGADVDPAQLSALAAQWGVVAPQSRLLTLIDVSGSMDAPVADGLSRIDLTREATQTALAVIPDQTAIGLWYFSTALEDDTDYREVMPLRALEDEVSDGVTQREALLAQTQELTVDLLWGDTGLHDSLWAAYQAMQDDVTDEEAISSVVLLTDGVNDDSTDGLSEEEVVDLLTEAREGGGHPVTVVLIGMGPDVDEEALQRLADAAGGESLVVRDPLELPQVFVDVVANRAR